MSDWRKTRPDARLESNKRSFIKKPALATPGLLEPIRSLQEPPASVLIADRLDTSRQTKSTVTPACSLPVSPPPRSSFDWWHHAKQSEEGASGSKSKRKRKRKTTILAQKIKQSDIQARRLERACLTKRKAGAGRSQKARKEDAQKKTQEELDREQVLREEREQLQALKRELQQRARQEREERERAQGFPDRAWWRAAGRRPH